MENQRNIFSNNDLLKLSDSELLNEIPKHKVTSIRNFLHELNRREYEVRFKKSCSFDEFKTKDKFKEEFGFGFNVDGNAVPYFHPNRSFHDEIIWLDKNVYYNEDCSFEDKLVNAAIVKFYGPSRTIEIITENTGKGYVQFNKLINDDDYVAKCMDNIHKAILKKEKIFGTTELRTSLQTESRNYTRKITTPYDKLLGIKNDSNRKGRGSDMLFWFRELGPKMKDFYKTKPTMEESFDFLTSFRGIGNYYGYHFSTNLARMPEIGSYHLLREGAISGNLNEDDEFVAPGVGAMITINYFYEHLGFSINSKVGAKVIRAIRADQDNFFDLFDENKRIVKEVFETGYLTTFGCEISCCQFGVFNRLKDNKKLAKKRSMAPIGKEKIESDCVIKDNAVEILKFEELKKAQITKKKPFKEVVIEAIEDSCTISVGLNIVSWEELKIKEVGHENYAKVEVKKVVETKKEPKKQVETKKEPKPKKSGVTYMPTDKQKTIIQDIIINLNSNTFSHKQVAIKITKEQLQYFQQDGNWKDSWKTLLYFTQVGFLTKEGRQYVYKK